MNCKEFQQQTRDWIRQGGPPEDAERHSAACAGCMQSLARERQLSAALADLAHAERDAGAPPAVERRVLEAFRRGRPRRFRFARIALAAAVLICVGIAAYRSRKAVPPRYAASAPPAGPFYVIAPGSAIEVDGFAPVVRMRLPRRELQRIGLAAWGSADAGTASLEVDVLVGRDGVAKAVRLVRNRESYITQ